MEDKNLKKVLAESGKKIVDALRKSLGKYQLGNSELAKNIKYKINKDVILIDIPEYGLYLDQGTKPHMPPVDKLKKWADAKGLNVWAVAQNINKFGTKAKPFLLTTDEINKEIKEDISIAFGKDIKMTTDEMFKKLKK